MQRVVLEEYDYLDPAVCCIGKPKIWRGTAWKEIFASLASYSGFIACSIKGWCSKRVKGLGEMNKIKYLTTIACLQPHATHRER